MFHAQDGFFFERLPNGEVEITVTSDGMAVAADSSNVAKRTLLAPNNWASVVASACSAGEDADTFAEAKKFHMER